MYVLRGSLWQMGDAVLGPEAANGLVTDASVHESSDMPLSSQGEW